MKLKKIISLLCVCLSIMYCKVDISYADSANVVTLGADLNTEQKDKILQYFGVDKNSVVILEVNNDEERKYLEGIATESQIGTKTYSCSYVEPTNNNSGIKVKTANLTWVTSSMIASTLATSGMDSCNVIVASLFPVSGTGGLTGIMKAFEDATGKPLDEEKKELASEELVTTGDLAENIGQDKATGIINDIKTEIIKNDTKDTTQIAETINNVTNNYNITLTADQEEQINSLMTKISKQNYDYKAMKNTLENVSDNISENLKAAGEKVKSPSFWKSLKKSFTNFFNTLSNLFNSKKDLGILDTTNDDLLGENAIINATENDAVKTASEEKSNWFAKFFPSNKASDSNQSEEIIPESAEDEKTYDENNTNNIDSNENSSENE